MLYATPALEAADEKVLAEIEEMRRDLRYRLAEPHRWDGLLRRQLQARAIQGSNSIEGYHASIEDIESIMSGEDPLEASAAVAREISGYRQALTYIGALARASAFRYDAGLLHALNFMMIGHHADAAPGTVRPGGIYVRDSATGEVVYEGPDHEQVPGLLAELVDWLNEGDLGAPSYVRAAMAHLNLVKIHPWRDGNGRMGRALQTLVLGRDQITTPEFASIEEWLGEGRTAYDYYDVLGEVGRRRWSPHGETLSWVRFVLRCHHMQAQRVGRRLTEAGEVWMLLEDRTAAQGLHPRTVSALYQVFVSRRLRRGMYQADEGLSQGQAARDLRELAATGWLQPYGETKGRFYAPGPKMTEIKAAFAERAAPLRDPYRALEG
ncbi:Fic family protein [Microbispora sp. SCL1-1]|uniref:Fic family protein n=1 Tax=Microbispora TaxID=2005 RepID=UPI00115ADC07|nr:MULTISPECIES: Fic family protein [unclassified Microbispora]NJP25842.1 Fic family protein [Microbispora sp. CL1-1]TQS12974.1 Fic family protein [Microbispora sp. SCL1-1]